MRHPRPEREALRREVFDYIEILYNATRRHSTLGMLSQWWARRPCSMRLFGCVDGRGVGCGGVRPTPEGRTVAAETGDYYLAADGERVEPPGRWAMLGSVGQDALGSMPAGR